MAMANDFFVEAQLALAAYANLPSSVPDITALEEAGIPTAQAVRFAETWTVITQYTDLTSGLSVTVSAPTSDLNARYLAIRGTEPAAATDLTADVLTEPSFNPHSIALLTDCIQSQPWRHARR
jgi:hypothetical protein